MPPDKRVLVTGCAGFIGSTLVDACLALGWEVIGVDCLTPYYAPSAKLMNVEKARSNPRFTYVERNILDLNLQQLVAEIDVVFHLAAQAGVRASWGATFDDYTEHNITALQRLLEATKDTPVERFVFASSSSVYGDAESLPTPEGVILRPVSPYGATKALGESLSHVYWRNYGVPVVSLRYFTVYGPRQRPDMAFHRVIEAARSGAAFPLFGDGSQTRDFTFVDDTVAGTLAAGLRGEPGVVYNLGGGSRVSMTHVLEVLGEVLGEPVRLDQRPFQRGDARDTAADTARAEADLGFRPTHSLEDGLAAQVAWHQERSDALRPATRR